MSRRRWALAVTASLALILLLNFTRVLYLQGLGQFLVRDDKLQPADLIIVLAGDFHGVRVLKACELVSAGYAPTILVSGGATFYGVNEADLAIRYASERGCPQDKMFAYRNIAFSTTEEARGIVPELQRRGVHSLIIVTSNYHTARAGRTCQKEFGREYQVRMSAARDDYFGPDRWWKTREGQKTTFYEYTKTIAAAIGM